MLALTACCPASGSAISLKEIELNRRPALLVSTRYYEAMVAADHGARIVGLRLKGSPREMGTFSADFDARLGPPGFAHSPYSYRVINRNGKEVFIQCSKRSDSGAVTKGALWQKMFIFRADSPAIQVIADVTPDRAEHVAYGTRNSLLSQAPAGKGEIYFVCGSATTKTIDSAKTQGDSEEWIRPGKNCVAGAVTPSTGEGLALVIARPEPKFVRVNLDNAAGLVHFEVSFPLRAASPAAPHRVVWSLIPLNAVRSVKHVLEKAAQLKGHGDSLDSVVGVKSMPKPPEPVGRKGPRRVLVASSAHHRGLYNFRRVFDTLPFPLEVQDVACVRGAYWPGENEFLRNLPASDEAWSRFAAAVFVDVPGWALTQHDGERLRNYVEHGGKLIFIGDQGRGYRDTTVGSLIPLRIPYDKVADKDREGRELLKDKSPWTNVTLPGFGHPALRGLPRNGLPKTIVHQAAAGGSTDVLMAAGVHPALVVRQLGQGHIVSMPISLAAEYQIDPALPPGLLAKAKSLDDTLTRWCFFGDLWRQLMAWLCGRTPKVFFSGLSVEHKKVLSVPAKLVFDYELGNACDQKTQAEVHIDFWRDGQSVKHLHSQARFELSPNKSVGQQTSASLDGARGHYRYVISVRDAKGHTMDWRDGDFLALPETYLAIDLGPLKAFAQDMPLPVQVFVYNIKTDQLLVKAEIFNEAGKRVASLEDARLKDIALARMAVQRTIDSPSLSPGRYSVRAALYAGPKLEKLIDTATDTFAVLPRRSPAAFPIVLGGLMLGDADDLVSQTERASQVGATAIHLPERFLGPAHFDAVAGRRLLSLIENAHEKRLGLLGELPEAAELLSRTCLPLLASQGLSPAASQGIRDYVAARIHDPSYFGVALLWPKHPTPHLHCETCQKFFRAKFGYDMPGPDSKQRYYYARKFLSDATSPAAKRVRQAVEQTKAPWKAIAIVDPESCFSGQYDPVQLCEAFDAIALKTAATARKQRLWLDTMRGAVSPGKTEFWGCVQVAPSAGRTWSPRNVPMQAYQALGRGAKGLYLRGYRDGPHEFTDNEAGVEATTQVVAQLRRVGTLFRELRPNQSTIGLLYPWASFWGGHPRRMIEGLARTRDAVEAAFGPVTVFHENAVIDDGSLAKMTVFVITQSSCIPERLAQALGTWTQAGGTLVAIGKVGAMDERRLPSRFGERVLGVSFGADAALPILGSSSKPRKGQVLNPIDAKVLRRYEPGQAAVAEKTVGQGRAVTVGFLPTGPELRSILHRQPDTQLARSPQSDVDVLTLTDGRSSAHYVVVVDREAAAQSDLEVLKLNDGKSSAQYVVPVALADTSREVKVWLPLGTWQPHVFDLVDGKPILVCENRTTRYVTLQLKRGWGRVLGLFPTKPAQLRLHAKVEKQALKYTVAILDASGTPVPYALAVEIDITDPEGKPRPEYGGTLSVLAGTRDSGLRLPANCPKGKWTVAARLRVGNLSGEKAFAVE